MVKAVLAGSSVAAGWAVLAPRRANAYYQGPVSDHFDGYQFFNPGREEPKGLGAFLRWHFRESTAKWPETYPSTFRDQPPKLVDADKMRVSYVGHASFLLQTGGHNILIDPVWADRASPVSFAGPRRVNPPGIEFDHLPRIDTVLVTHNHYDHMDVALIARLWARDNPRIITPLGNDTILRSAVAGLVAEAFDWEAAIPLSAATLVHVEPTQHWSARGAFDRRHALWASFVVESPAGKIYCVGDSGFGEGWAFRRVAKRHPEIELALLPIGAYEPRWFMRTQHMNPDESVQSLLLCGARRAIGHHWGTFQLTNEPIDAPVQALEAALAQHGVEGGRFQAFRPGQVLTID